MAGNEIGIGEVSRRTGCNIETIRYYERIGLVPKPERTASRYRIYAREDVQRLVFVRRARELGFTPGRDTRPAAARRPCPSPSARCRGRLPPPPGRGGPRRSDRARSR